MTTTKVDMTVTGEISRAAAMGLAGMINRVAATGEVEGTTVAIGRIGAAEDGSLVETSGVGERWDRV